MAFNNERASSPKQQHYIQVLLQQQQNSQYILRKPVEEFSLSEASSVIAFLKERKGWAGNINALLLLKGPKLPELSGDYLIADSI